MMKPLYLFALTMLSVFSLQAQNQNITFRSKMSFPGQTVANVCGYAAGGREYALLGGSLGLIIVDVTNPDAPVQITQIPGPNSLWKEIKTYSHYVYTVTEGGQGIHIVDLSNLPTANLDSYFFIGDGVISGALLTIHSLHIDTTKGYLYAFGSNLSSGGAVVFDLNQDPYNPKYVGAYDQLQYVHDGYVDNDTLYASHINIGLFAIVDMTDKANPVVLNTQQTPNSFTHNTWLSEDRKVIFTTDETPSSYVAAYDVSNPEDIQFLDKIQSNPGSGSIGHNTHILGKYAVTAWYRDGVTIVDATLPYNLVQVGNYDTYPQGVGDGFDGAWGVYPYLPSGNLIVGNMVPGEMYVLTPTYVRAAYLKGTVTDQVTGNPLSGVKVQFVGNDASRELSNNIGQYNMGQVQAGAVQVRVSKLGYQTAIVPVTIVTGVETVLNIALTAGSAFTVNGNVVRSTDGAAVPNAFVAVSSPDTTYNVSADANGQFSIPGIFEGEYNVIAGAWGYLYTVLQDEIISNSQQFSLSLNKGYQDDFVFDYGWTASGTSATGKWERAEPVGINVGAQIAPETDILTDLGDQCYVTGNGSSGVDEDDVESGTSILLSPVMDLSGYVNPHIFAQYWITSFTIQQQSLDSIKIYVSNGLEEKLVLVRKGDILEWSQLSFDVKDFVTPTANVRLRIVCRDNPAFTGFDSYEAAFDNFAVTEGVLGSAEPHDALQLSAQPNPFTNSTVLAWKGAEKNLSLQVFDLLGRPVQTLDLSGTNGQVVIGSELKSGVYFARVMQEGAAMKTVKILKIN
jgi:choice-of-anchor B domain-containing protein